MTKPNWILGIDGGGTKCHAVPSDLQGRVLARSVSGPANAFTDADLAKASIIEASDAVLAQIGQGPAAKALTTPYSQG